MPSVDVRCFSSPLPEWRRARHVLGHCRAIRAVLTADVTPILPEALRPKLLPICDVSARREVTNLALAELILQRLGKDPEEWIEHVADRPKHDRRYLIESAKLERELGWPWTSRPAWPRPSTGAWRTKSGGRTSRAARASSRSPDRQFSNAATRAGAVPRRA
jgi:hypothetical protein